MFRMFILLLSLGLIACSPAERPVEEDAVSSSSDMASEEVPEPTGYTEYLWCSKGENYSKESGDARNAMWVEAVNALGMTNLGSAEITPSGWSSENFDHTSVLFWESKEARDAGWEAYLTSDIEEKLNEAYPGVETCGGEGWKNVYPTSSYRIREAKLSEAFKVGYQFCNFNEDKGVEDLRTFVRGPWAEFLGRYDSENPSSSYGLLINVRDFDDEEVEVHEGVPDTFDYLWVNLWGDPAEMDQGNAAVAQYGQDMMQAANGISTCSDEQIWDGRNIKTRS